MSGTIIPVSEMNDYSGEHLSWDLDLPEYVPSKTIGVNVTRLQHMIRVAGLGHLRIDSVDGDQTIYEAEVTGFDAQGTATSTMKATKQKAALSYTQVDQTDSDRWRKSYSEYLWGNGHIAINATELSDRMLDEARDGRSLRDASLWGMFLDKEIRKGISKNASEQLLGSIGSTSVIALVTSTIESVTWNGWHLNARSPMTFLLASVVNQGMFTATAQYKGLPFNERRLSLLPAYQLDRLATVKGLTKALKVIKPIK